MANTMLNNSKIKINKNGNLEEKLRVFEQQIKNSGKTPEQILREQVMSGKVSMELLNKAIEWAKNIRL